MTDAPLFASPYFIVIFNVWGCLILLKYCDISLSLVLLDSPNPYSTDIHILLFVLNPMVKPLANFPMFPSFLLVHVTLVFPLRFLYPCIHKYYVGSNFYS